MISGQNVRYIVPQVIDKENLKEGDIRLQLRVTQPLEELVWIEISDGENSITRKGSKWRSTTQSADNTGVSTSR